jgi:hypothetical protein
MKRSLERCPSADFQPATSLISTLAFLWRRAEKRLEEAQGRFKEPPQEYH